jgi:hypothetical protein
VIASAASSNPMTLAAPRSPSSRSGFFPQGSAVAQRFEDRRASIYRVRARELAEAARDERREEVHRHMLDQAASYKRAAEAMSPAKRESKKH